ncbi:MAG: hypothetical protein Q9186_001751 [Xanthomendoza sp. 1 TL-2023]
MASQPAAAQKSSRWGAFLAGVESRLDTILADEDQPASKPKPDGTQQLQNVRKETMAPPSSNTAAGESISRPSSTSRAQDRLNERLAKAVANRNLKRMDDKSPATSGLPSRTESPVNGTESSRPSTEITRERPSMEQDQLSTESVTNKDESLDGLQESKQQPQPEKFTAELPTIQVEGLDSRRPSLDSRRSESVRPSLDLARPPTETLGSPQTNGFPTIEGIQPPSPPPSEQQTIEQMRSDFEVAEVRRQEETHTYLERIDALQSKLQYLTKEATGAAKNARSEAEPGSLEDKVAAKDEKIALLMEEGHKLSQTELKHMSIIKKLRAKASEDDKRMTESKKLVQKYEKAAGDAQQKAKRAEEATKRASEQARSLPRLVEDLATMRADRDTQDALIQDLQTRLTEATSNARQAEERAQADALQAEKKRTADLGDELSNFKIEKESVQRQYQTELRELREKVERERERARIAEIERQGEQNILESRLEAYRARAEEASAGSGGNVQAKLLRQVETLQNQYAVASENWQGIEGSLLARASALEKERDDLAKREAEIRRKARETNMKTRRAEEELERLTAKTHELDHETLQQRSQLASLRDKLTNAEADATAARKKLIAERESWEAKYVQRSEEERVQQQYNSRTPDAIEQQFRTESPVTSGHHRKASNAADRASPHNPRRLQGLAITGTTAERPVSRRSSTQPLNYNSDHHRSLSRQDSMSFAGIPETPSIQIDNQDNFFDGIRTPATPERTINDMISVSTAGAGPSVQLVERMSAAVRRLESEKAAHKDELARLSTQRDEAREQILGLMKEAEEKRAADARAMKLEKEVEELNARYLTTLEMLGEKSEKVDELKADVADLKEMYRELVDRTM